MIEYVLILTLVGSTLQSGQSIDHIGGFATNQECVDAGNAWLQQIRATEEYRIPRAICVKRTAVGKSVDEVK